MCGAERGAELLDGAADSQEQRLALADWRDLHRVLAWFRDGSTACREAELAFSPSLSKDHRAQVTRHRLSQPLPAQAAPAEA